MIEIKETDIIYQLDKSALDLQGVQIPRNVTVFDASNCTNFDDLKGLQKYSNLRVLLLNGTDVHASDLQYIPSGVEAIDLRYCKNIKNYSLMPQRAEKPIFAFISFGGERVLDTIPSLVDIEIEGFLNKICSRKKANFLSKTNSRC